MGALLRFTNAVPPQRGAFWLAAGLRGTSFGSSTSPRCAFALDRGVEVGLLERGAPPCRRTRRRW